MIKKHGYRLSDTIHDLWNILVIISLIQHIEVEEDV